VAVNCCERPAGTEAVDGVTARDFNVAVVVLRVAVPVIPFKEALMVVVPAAIALATPLLRMVATAVFEDVHVTEFVMLFVLWSE
jgi:hypothetical protein